jgi:hypothetical protein
MLRIFRNAIGNQNAQDFSASMTNPPTLTESTHKVIQGIISLSPFLYQFAIAPFNGFTTGLGEIYFFIVFGYMYIFREFMEFTGNFIASKWVARK